MAADLMLAIGSSLLLYPADSHTPKAAASSSMPPADP
jgi:hypothetical protein